MNIRKLSMLLGTGLIVASGNVLAFTDDDEVQTPTAAVTESCTISTTTAAAVTQANLENGVSDDAAIFGTVTSSCNSASGFKYQILGNNATTCTFKHASLSNNVTYTVNSSTPAVSNGSGTVAHLSDTCPDTTAGYVDVWTVSAGSTHVSNTLSLQTTLAASGAGTLPDGNYSTTLTIRLADI
jgi:hypothetical protein